MGICGLQVGLKLVPDNVTFMNLLLAKDETYDSLKDEMQTLVSLLGPFLEEIQSILVSNRVIFVCNNLVFVCISLLIFVF